MTPEQFCYWLQGALELANPNELTPEQVQIIKDHLQLVFVKKTPDRRPFPDLKKKEHPDWAGPSQQPLCANVNDVAEMVKDLPVAVSC